MMAAGSILGNTVSGYGGGVYVQQGESHLPNGKFSKTAGTINGGTGIASPNKAGGDTQGHAAYVQSGPKYRDTTAGANRALDTAAPGGWGP